MENEMFQTLRKLFLHPAELKLLALAEESKDIKRHKKYYRSSESENEYAVTLAYSTIIIKGTTVTLFCNNTMKESKVSKLFVACIDYLYKRDHTRASAVLKAVEQSELAANVEKFTECAKKER